MKLPPYRYPGYYSLPRMLFERFCSDKATGALGKVITGGKKKAPIDHRNVDSH